MQLDLERDRIRIVPTGKQDVAYIEDTLGLIKDGDTIELKRVNAHNLSSVAYLEAKRKLLNCSINGIPIDEDTFDCIAETWGVRL